MNIPHATDSGLPGSSIYELVENTSKSCGESFPCKRATGIVDPTTGDVLIFFATN